MTAILAVVSLGLAAMVVGVQRVRQGLVDGAQHFRLHFGSPVEAKAVEHFLAGSAGWRAPWFRPWASPVVMAEVMATKDGVSFTFVVPQVWVISFERLLDAHLPGIHAQRVTAESLVVTAAATYRLTASDRPLRVEPAAQVRTLLSALQPLGDDDRIVVQWAFSPQSPVTPSPDASSGWRAKQSAPVLGAVLRIGAAAPNVRAAQALVRRAEVALHLSNGIGVHFARVRVPEHSVIRRLNGRRVPIGAPPIVINVHELVGPLGFPVGTTLPSGIAPPGCRPLRASEALPSEGSVVGDSDMPGDARPVALSLEARFHHVMLSGPTGVGKSTLLLNLICDDLERGRGVLLLDPKRDLFEDVMARVPEHRRDDVVVLDPAAAEGPVVGFNPLSGGGDAELNVEQVVSVMHRLWASSWGVRTEDLLRASLRTLTSDPEATLADIGPLLTDPRFRSRLTPKVTDPTLRAQWAAFEQLSTAEQSQWISPLLTKLRAILSRPSLRRTLCQPAPAFDLSRALNSGGVVLVPLSAGTLGADAASLFGSLVLGAAWDAIQARAATSERPAVMFHIDELARFVALPLPLDDLLAQARSYRVGCSLGLQHLHQLPPDLRSAALSNVRSRVAFQPAHEDAQVLARQFGLDLSASDLMALEAYQVVAQLYAAGRSQPTCTLRTRPAPAVTTDGAVLRAESARRWGRDGAEVDAFLDARLSGRDQSTSARRAPGRRPRGAA